jgi:nucleotide-binding universal stress UspA family protein
MSLAPVIIAYDGSPGSHAAIRRAAELFASREATVVTAWSSVLMVAPAGFGIPAYLDDLDPELEKRAAETAEEGAELAREAGLAARPLVVRGSPPWSALVRAADEMEAAVVVVGARGLSPVRSALLGSTSSGVVHHTNRPVLVVQERQQGDKP